MTSQAITPKSLSQCIYESDFYNYVDILDPDKKEEQINSAYNYSQSLESTFSITKIKRNGKDCYTLADFDQTLVSRNLASNIRAVLRKAKSRNQISRQLIQHLKEGTSYRIYRLDIKSFFESVKHTTIVNALEKSRISNQTKLLICSIIKSSQEISDCGLPRGLEFSPNLSELILKDFDEEMKKHSDVFFYSRYVDDIILITTGFESSRAFLKKIKSTLPSELKLNYNKQQVITVECRAKNDKIVAGFDYLGCHYSVRDSENKNNKQVFRAIDVSLSASRVKKIKTRISKSLFLYSKDGKFNILKQRLDFLTSNRLMKDKKSNRTIATGIYYSNVNLSKNNNSLVELDEHLKKAVLGYASKRSANYSYHLTAPQKKELLKFSFVNGYKNNNYKRFSPNKLNEIKNAWRY